MKRFIQITSMIIIIIHSVQQQLIQAVYSGTVIAIRHTCMYHQPQSYGNIIFMSSILQDTKVMSWWDYGYQITAMANRTILVDNNTWNNTHISRVGQVSMVQ